MGNNWQATWKMGKYISIIFLSQGKVADCLYTSQSENDTIIPELMRGVITPPPKSKLGGMNKELSMPFFTLAPSLLIDQQISTLYLLI